MKEFLTNASIIIGFIIWIGLLMLMQKKSNEQISKLKDDNQFGE